MYYALTMNGQKVQVILLTYNLLRKKAEINKRTTWNSPNPILTIGSVRKTLGVTLNKGINNVRQTVSHRTSIMLLIKLAIRDKLISIFVKLVRIINSKKTEQIV